MLCSPCDEAVILYKMSFEAATRGAKNLGDKTNIAVQRQEVVKIPMIRSNSVGGTSFKVIVLIMWK